jgi:cytidylate kinase
MAVDAQTVIEALIRALEEPPQRVRRLRKPVITVSRTVASRGDEVARMVAERLGLECYDREILDQIAVEANVSKNMIQNLTERLDAVETWVYSTVFGKNMSRDIYLRYLTTIIRGLYHTGGVICGRGAHVILAGRDVLRVRIVGSIEACASRLAEEEGITYTEAKRRVQESNKRREKFIWELFHSRYDDPTNFDLVVNTDNFRHVENIADVVLAAVRARGLDKRAQPKTQAATASGA